MATLKFYLLKVVIFLSSSSTAGEGESGGGGVPGVDEIVEAIQNGFNNTVDGIFERLKLSVTGIILDFFQTQIMFVFNWMTVMLLNFSSNVFETGFVQQWFSVISLLSKLCFVVGLTLYVANNCIKMSAGRKALMASDVKTYIIYLGFGWFGVDGAVLIFQQINNFLASNLISESVDSLESAMLIEAGAWGDTAIIQIIIFIIVIICFVSFFISVMKRLGYIFALISVIPVYMLSFSKGYSSGFFSWLRMFASCCITFFLQYTMFYLGISLLVSNAFVLAILFFIAMPVVPRVLAQFGNGITTMGDIMSDVTETAKQGTKMATTAATGAL